MTNNEALKMLSRAFWHLRNRDMQQDTNDARALLVAAQDRIVDEMYKEAA